MARHRIDFFQKLPNVLIKYIISYLSPYEFFLLRLTNKKLKKIVDESNLFWKNKLKINFPDTFSNLVEAYIFPHEANWKKMFKDCVLSDLNRLSPKQINLLFALQEENIEKIKSMSFSRRDLFAKDNFEQPVITALWNKNGLIKEQLIEIIIGKCFPKEYDYSNEELQFILTCEIDYFIKKTDTLPVDLEPYTIYLTNDNTSKLEYSYTVCNHKQVVHSGIISYKNIGSDLAKREDHFKILELISQSGHIRFRNYDKYYDFYIKNNDQESVEKVKFLIENSIFLNHRSLVRLYYTAYKNRFDNRSVIEKIATYAKPSYFSTVTMNLPLNRKLSNDKELWQFFVKNKETFQKYLKTINVSATDFYQNTITKSYLFDQLCNYEHFDMLDELSKANVKFYFEEREVSYFHRVCFNGSLTLLNKLIDNPDEMKSIQKQLVENEMLILSSLIEAENFDVLSFLFDKKIICINFLSKNFHSFKENYLSKITSLNAVDSLAKLFIFYNQKTLFKQLLYADKNIATQLDSQNRTLLQFAVERHFVAGVRFLFSFPEVQNQLKVLGATILPSLIQHHTFYVTQYLDEITEDHLKMQTPFTKPFLYVGISKEELVCRLTSMPVGKSIILGKEELGYVCEHDPVEKFETKIHEYLVNNNLISDYTSLIKKLIDDNKITLEIDDLGIIVAALKNGLEKLHIKIHPVNHCKDYPVHIYFVNNKVELNNVNTRTCFIFEKANTKKPSYHYITHDNQSIKISNHNKFDYKKYNSNNATEMRLNVADMPKKWSTFLLKQHYFSISTHEYINSLINSCKNNPVLFAAEYNGCNLLNWALIALLNLDLRNEPKILVDIISKLLVLTPDTNQSIAEGFDEGKTTLYLLLELIIKYGFGSLAPILKTLLNNKKVDLLPLFSTPIYGIKLLDYAEKFNNEELNKLIENTLNTLFQSEHKLFHAAIKFQDERIVKYLLRLGAFMHAYDPKYNSPLFALDYPLDNSNIISLLVDYNVDVNTKNIQGLTFWWPILVKIEFSCELFLNKLLLISQQKRISIDLSVENPLLKKSLIRYLLDKKDWTSILLLLKDKVSAYTDLFNHRDILLKTAVIENQVKMVKLLCAHEFLSQSNGTFCPSVLFLINPKTPVKILECLLSLPIDINQSNQNGMVPLWFGFEYKMKHPDKLIANIIDVARKKRIYLDLNIEHPTSRQTFLQYFISNKDWKTVILLLEENVKIDYFSKEKILQFIEDENKIINHDEKNWKSNRRLHLHDQLSDALESWQIRNGHNPELNGVVILEKSDKKRRLEFFTTEENRFDKKPKDDEDKDKDEDKVNQFNFIDFDNYDDLESLFNFN